MTVSQCPYMFVPATAWTLSARCTWPMAAARDTVAIDTPAQAILQHHWHRRIVCGWPSSAPQSKLLSSNTCWRWRICSPDHRTAHRMMHQCASSCPWFSFRTDLDRWWRPFCLANCRAECDIGWTWRSHCPGRWGRSSRPDRRQWRPAVADAFYDRVPAPEMHSGHGVRRRPCTVAHTQSDAWSTCPDCRSNIWPPQSRACVW